MVVGSEGDAVVSVKIKSKEQIFSAFDYDSNEKLNPELSEYIYEKAQNVPPKLGVKLKIYAFEKVNENEVKEAVHKNFEREYQEARAESRRNWLLIFAMTLLGLLTLTVLFLSYVYFENVYLDTILEIATWVFFWEAVDALFLKRTGLRHKRVLSLKLCICDIEVIDLSKKKAKCED